MESDKHFRVETLNHTIDPQQLVYAAMHTDYCEEFVFDDLDWLSSYDTGSFYNRKGISEKEAGERIVKHLLAGHKGHYGCLEHPSITFAVGWFPHSVMQQARTHRVGITFDVQSGRYTGRRILDVVEGKRDIEEVFYFRPAGFYSDRQGKKYEYTEDDRKHDIKTCFALCLHYAKRVNDGFSEEHARDMIPYAIRQHFTVSFNARSLMHFLDLRAKKDAQLEIQQLCEMMLPHFRSWMPELSRWYEDNRLYKARLAP